MDIAERCKNARASATAHRRDENGVAIVIVDDHNVIVVGTGCNDEFSSLIGVNLAGGGFDDGSETVMGSCVVRGAKRKGVGGRVIGGVRVGWWCARNHFSRFLIFTRLIQMPFDHCDRCRWVFA